MNFWLLGPPTGRVTVAITLAVKDAPTRRRRLAKLLERQAAISASEGMGQEPIDPALESELASWR